MKKPLVSIICPVYKAEKYLSRCIDSIVVQTLSNWELVLVDDGSPDSSGSICDSYASKDSRIKVIHISNGGVGNARQVGLDASQGEFVLHVDPDDWIESVMLEKMYRKASSLQADMVICDFIYDYSNKTEILRQSPSNISANNEIIHDILIHNIHGSCCNKLTRKDAIMNSQAHFYKGLNYCEDVIFNLQLLKTPIKVVYLKEALYHYDQTVNENSLTSKTTKNQLYQRKHYVDIISCFLFNHYEILKELKGKVKKFAIYNGFVTKDEILKIYPEIKSARSTFFLDSFFYTLGFRGYTNIVAPYFFLKRKMVVFLSYMSNLVFSVRKHFN